MAGKARVSNGSARIPAASVTGSYQNLGPAMTRAATMIISNSLNTETILSLDNGGTDFVTLQPSQSLTIDFCANGLTYGGRAQIKHTGSAPASGAISIGYVGRDA